MDGTTGSSKPTSPTRTGRQYLHQPDASRRLTKVKWLERWQVQPLPTRAPAATVVSCGGMLGSGSYQ